MALRGWSVMRLGDFVTLQRGHDLPDQEREPGDVPILGSFGITGYHNKARARGPGVTVGRSGASFGVVSYSAVDYWPLNTALYVIDFHGNDERFAYYFLKQFDFSHFNSGSAQPSLNRNYIHPIAVEIPPLPEQRAIAAVLGALDDKIELNRRMNGTLEALARALFRSWFVDFDPVRAKMEGRETGLPAEIAALFPDGLEVGEDGVERPRGWRVGEIRDLGLVVCGKTPPTSNREYYGDDVPFITIPDMHGKTFVIETGKYLSQTGAEFQKNKFLPPDSVCVSCIATPGLVVLTTEPSQTNQQINSIIPNDKYPGRFSFFLMERMGEKIRSSGSGGSVYHNLSKGRFETLNIILPTSELAHVFSQLVDPILDRIIVNQQQAQILSILRDTLLPKLMSGEVRVSNIAFAHKG